MRGKLASPVLRGGWRSNAPPLPDSDAPADDLRDLAASLGPNAKEAYVTTADMLEARGEARGRAEDILVVFDQRGIDVDDKSRELIGSCTDLDALNSWFRRSLKVDKASDLFEE